MPEKIAQIQNDYGVREILFVGDRGMITQANAQKVRGIEGLNPTSATGREKCLFWGVGTCNPPHR